MNSSFLDRASSSHQDQLKVHQQVLFKKFKCSPMPTMLVPAITQLPLFVASSIFFGHVAQRPSPLDAESFLTLSSLARPDPTGTLPIALGLITLANVETAQWFVDPDKLASGAKSQQQNENRKDVPTVPRLKTIVQSSLRGLSVFRIVVATMVDGVRCSVILTSLTRMTSFLLWIYYSLSFSIG